MSRTGRTPTASRTAGTGRASKPAPAREPDEERSVLRLGGPEGLAVPLRAIVLVLVTLFAFIVTFPSLREYLSQRARYDAVVAQVAEVKATNQALEDQLAQWDDDEYVKSQARQRLSYVMPGETTYVVVDADSVTETEDAAASGAATDQRDPWYVALRETVRVAGEVPTADTTSPAQQGWSTPGPTTAPTSTPEPATQETP